jgi:hypothetical protein
MSIGQGHLKDNPGPICLTWPDLTSGLPNRSIIASSFGATTTMQLNKYSVITANKTRGAIHFSSSL